MNRPPGTIRPLPMRLQSCWHVVQSALLRCSRLKLVKGQFAPTLHAIQVCHVFATLSSTFRIHSPSVPLCSAGISCISLLIGRSPARCLLPCSALPCLCWLLPCPLLRLACRLPCLLLRLARRLALLRPTMQAQGLIVPTRGFSPFRLYRLCHQGVVEGRSIRENRHNRQVRRAGLLFRLGVAQSYGACRVTDGWCRQAGASCAQSPGHRPWAPDLPRCWCP